MELEKLTIKAQEAVQRAQQIAMEHEQQSIECSHLLKGILEVDEYVFPFLSKKLSVNQQYIEHALDQMIQQVPKVSGGESYFSRETATALNKAQSSLKEFGDEFIALEHLLLGIFRALEICACVRPSLIMPRHSNISIVLVTALAISLPYRLIFPLSYTFQSFLIIF